MFVQLENDDSPIHVACTQEASNDVDVIWDWNSPQGKQQSKRTNRSLMKSSKIPLKRHPSNNQIQNFDKLRQELKILKDAISIPDNEECLVLSPVQEQEYKCAINFHNEPMRSPQREDCQTQNSLFDDSADEQLLLLSQKIETELCNSVAHVKNELSCSAEDDMRSKMYSIKHGRNLSNKTNLGFCSNQDTKCDVKIDDDSFNNILETFKEECDKSFTAIFDTTITREDIKNKHVFCRTKSENIVSKQTTGKVEFHRTESFESTLEYKEEAIPRFILDEIERKRKAALAKLESKRKQEDGSNTPIKCTPQEIEQKRLQALAKREAKRQQEIIERKRKEALKRLELSRKKNATIVKSSLTKRL